MFVIILGTFTIRFVQLSSSLLVILTYFGPDPKSLEMNRLFFFFPTDWSECCIFATSARCLEAVAPVTAKSFFHLIFSLCVLGGNSKVLSTVLANAIYSCLNKKITKLGILPLVLLK